MDISEVPNRIGHGYIPIEVLGLEFLDTEYAIAHHRLEVFHHKGLKCANEGCNEEGVYVIKGQQRSKKGRLGSMHIDVYTKDFKLMTVDHIIPRSSGGPDLLWNKQPMCEYCNTRKGSNIPKGLEAEALELSEKLKKSQEVECQ